MGVVAVVGIAATYFEPSKQRATEPVRVTMAVHGEPSVYDDPPRVQPAVNTEKETAKPTEAKSAQPPYWALPAARFCGTHSPFAAKKRPGPEVILAKDVWEGPCISAIFRSKALCDDYRKRAIIDRAMGLLQYVDLPCTPIDGCLALRQELEQRSVPQCLPIAKE